MEIESLWQMIDILLLSMTNMEKFISKTILEVVMLNECIPLKLERQIVLKFIGKIKVGKSRKELKVSDTFNFS